MIRIAGDLARTAPASTAAAIWNAPRLGRALRIVLSLLLLPVVFNLLLPGRRPVGILLFGTVIGALYGLIAIGLILVYRANHVVNFAQAGLGAVPAVVALMLITNKGWPYPAVLPVLVVGALALGAAVEIGFIRRFASAPRLILAVVTIGVAQLLAYVEFNIPAWISGETLPPTEFPTPFSTFRFRLGGTIFKGDHLAAVLVVIGCVAGLAAFLRFSRVGIAVRASAENAERASLLGIPVRRVSTLVWMIATLLSALGIFLRAPLVGLPLGTIIGPSILLYALAAAVVARMEDLTLAFVAGLAMGAIDVGVFYSTRDAVLSDAVMLPVILIALLVQRGRTERARDTGVSTWRTVREFRPVPFELRGITEVRAVRTGLFVLAAGLSIALPHILGPLYRNDASLLLIYAMIGLSLVILTGWAGQISLGQFGFVAVGAAVAGGLAANHTWDMFVTLAVAGVAGAAIAVLIGLPALRMQGLFLAVTTLAFAAAMRSFVLDRDRFGWLLPEPGAIVYRPRLYGRIDSGNDLVFYYVCLVFLVLFMAVARQIRRSRSGRVLIATQSNARAAQSYGVNLPRTRLAAFAISGFMAAVAGGLFAYQQGAVDAGSFPAINSLKVFAMTVVGGLTSIGGAVAGAAYLIGFQRFPVLRDIRLLELLATGVGMVVLLLFFPGGLSELAFRGRDAFLRRVASKRGVHVPSLVADSLTDEASREPVALSHGAALTGEAADTGTILCPACGASVALDEAADHEHFVRPGAAQRARRRRDRVAAVAAEQPVASVIDPDTGERL